jgi:hypothetical protein
MKMTKASKKNSTKKTTTETKLPVVRKAGASNKSIDPLYVIFEQHLFNFAESVRLWKRDTAGGVL